MNIKLHKQKKIISLNIRQKDKYYFALIIKKFYQYEKCWPMNYQYINFFYLSVFIRYSISIFLDTSICLISIDEISEPINITTWDIYIYMCVNHLR